MIDRVKPEYQSATEEFQFGSPHQILALFAWKDWDVDEFGRGPCDLPRVLCVDDDLLSSPQAAPHLAGLQTGIWVDPNTGEEIEHPEIWMRLDEEGTDQFKAFVLRMEKLFGVLKPQTLGWDFLERSLAYFMKASRSMGLEQLLWHIITMEALLGESENNKGANERFKNRINMTLGQKKRSKQNGRKMTPINELYEFRNTLVHGKRFNDDDPVLRTHLAEARNMARKALLWSLHYLHAVQIGISSSHAGATVPSREQLLKFLDEYRKTQQLPKWLTNLPPVGFPYVQEWIE